MAFDIYINQGTKRLRCGYTTGSCATLASKAAARALLENRIVESEEIITPKGITVKVDIMEYEKKDDSVRCAVKKDAGDDFDATDGILIYSKVELTEEEGIHIDGGVGVGRVTEVGLNQPVGNAAINTTPRRMITDELTKLAEEHEYSGGFNVMIDVPNGIEIAKKTFNGKLGIEGGISVIGTTGIVEPQSLQALIDTIKVEMKMLAAKGDKSIIITPGNYGSAFIKRHPKLKKKTVVSYSNFIGDTLDFGNAYGFDEILVVSHIGKAVKLAGGIMNTHSRYADCRSEIFAAYAALEGGDKKVIERIMDAKTTDACIEILKEKNLHDGTIDRIIKSAQEHLEYRVAGKYKVGLVIFSNKYGLLGMSEASEEIIEGWEKSE
jgi:cobalt-precorrin-5B (C1)-methyltransferase